MAEVNNNGKASLPEQEPDVSTPLPSKRKPDLDRTEDERENKKPEISANNHHVDEETLKIDQENLAAKPESEENRDDDDEEEEEEEEEDSGDEDDDDDDEAEDDVDDEAPSDGTEMVDRKGKGIMREDKGKGKLVVGDDSDSGNEGNISDGDSDLSDDPLAEVDLDNILPSRTRRRVAQPGAYLVNDMDEDEDEDDDSDDSDA